MNLFYRKLFNIDITRSNLLTPSWIEEWGLREWRRKGRNGG